MRTAEVVVALVIMAGWVAPSAAAAPAAAGVGPMPEETIAKARELANATLEAAFGLASTASAAVCAPLSIAPTPAAACSDASVLAAAQRQADAIADAAFKAAMSIDPDPTLCAMRDGLNGLVDGAGDNVPADCP